MMRIDRLICPLLIIVVFAVTVSPAHSLSVKTRGKLALVAALSGVAVVTKLLVKKDQRAVEVLHETMGKPDRVIEFEHGFDHWRIEWYGEKKYIFRNNVLLRCESGRPVP